MDKKLMMISTSMLVLKLLEKQDMYGYQIIKELEEQSNKVFALKEGTLYPILHGLEKEGAVEGFERAAETGRMRKYYRITKKGTALLNQKQEEWNAYQKAVNGVLGGVCFGIE